jgi:hypothetical protein
MGFPAVPIFLVLLAVYVAYSWWTDLDPRYPLGAAFALLIAAAGLAAAGAIAAANTVAVFVFLLLGAGVVLLLATELRKRRRGGGRDEGPGGPRQVPGEPADERDLAPQHPLDRLEQEPVPFIEAPGHEDGHDE